MQFWALKSNKNSNLTPLQNMQFICSKKCKLLIHNNLQLHPKYAVLEKNAVRNSNKNNNLALNLIKLIIYA